MEMKNSYNSIHIVVQQILEGKSWYLRFIANTLLSQHEVVAVTLSGHHKVTVVTLSGQHKVVIVTLSRQHGFVAVNLL